MEGVARLFLEDHIHHCVQAAIDSGDPADQHAKFQELIGRLEKTPIEVSLALAAELPLFPIMMSTNGGVAS
ncbi:hypothetical protein GLR48_07805 [Loktanella sp. M215]|nr:hypothetical protein [Loktanella sp. M215]